MIAATNLLVGLQILEVLPGGDQAEHVDVDGLTQAPEHLQVERWEPRTTDQADARRQCRANLLVRDLQHEALDALSQVMRAQARRKQSPQIVLKIPRTLACLPSENQPRAIGEVLVVEVSQLLGQGQARKARRAPSQVLAHQVVARLVGDLAEQSVDLPGESRSLVALSLGLGPEQLP